MCFLKKKEEKLINLSFLDEPMKIPDLGSFEARKECVEDKKIIEAVFYVNGHGEYPPDFQISLYFWPYKEDSIKEIFCERITKEDWVFNLEKNLTPLLKNFSPRGVWKVKVKDVEEEDENTLTKILLVLKVV